MGRHMRNLTSPVLRAPVRLDFQARPTFEAFLQEHREAPELVIDFADVQYLESSGMWLLEEMCRRTMNQVMRLENVSPAIGRVLSLAGLDPAHCRFGVTP